VQSDLTKNLKHNFIVNITDGAFFGLALGFASTVAVVPLYIASMTDSTTVVGLIVSMLAVGWRLPQLFTSNHVAGLRQYKRYVIWTTLHERWPFFGLALVALALPVLGPQLVLILTLLLFMWHGMGAGVTGTGWQSMISKIIPAERRGTFYGIQSAAAALMQSGGVFIASWLLERLPSPLDYAVCFFLAGVAMFISYYFLARTREPDSEPNNVDKREWRTFVGRLKGILHTDVNFRWFLGARMMAEFTIMAQLFFTLFAVRRFGLEDSIAVAATGILMLAQTVATPILGWVGDHYGHRRVYAFGIFLTAVSAFMVLTATNPNMLYLAYVMSGAAQGSLWATVIAFTCEFGTPQERPYYIGLANTTVAPAALIAPLVGGWLADTFGFEATFLVAGISGLLTAAVLAFALHDPKPELVAQSVGTD
jgi:MFS family permease